jgi:ribokinase
MPDRRDDHDPLRLALIGHVEHVTLGRVAEVPRAGEIVHLREERVLAGGGGGIAFLQLARSDAEVHLFTAVGRDDAGEEVAAELGRLAAANPRVRLHLARRPAPHNRCLVMVDGAGERTIVVIGEPLQPAAADPLPWHLLERCDGAYFTASEPAALRAARGARVLVATARRRPVVVASGVRVDAVVGSAADARERSTLADYPVPPVALVMTEGARGGAVTTAGWSRRFPAPPAAPSGGGAYGAGDSFAAALTYYLAAGCEITDACTRAGPHGAAVLRGLDPREGQLVLARPG